MLDIYLCKIASKQFLFQDLNSTSTWLPYLTSQEDSCLSSAGASSRQHLVPQFLFSSEQFSNCFLWYFSKKCNFTSCRSGRKQKPTILNLGFFLLGNRNWTQDCVCQAGAYASELYPQPKLRFSKRTLCPTQVD